MSLPAVRGSGGQQEAVDANCSSVIIVDPFAMVGIETLMIPAIAVELPPLLDAFGVGAPVREGLHGEALSSHCRAKRTRRQGFIPFILANFREDLTTLRVLTLHLSEAEVDIRAPLLTAGVRLISQSSFHLSLAPAAGVWDEALRIGR